MQLINWVDSETAVGKKNVAGDKIKEPNKPDPKIIYEIIKEAVLIEKEFITESFSCELLGMNKTMMNTYIEFVADRLLAQLNYDKIWNSNNPFPFMDRISIESKSNFFEFFFQESNNLDLLINF